MTLNSIVVWVVVGGVAGTIADWLVSGIRMGCLGTLIIGIIGAFVGAWLLGLLNVSIGTGIVNDIITASIGAIVLLLGIRTLRRV
jgi:uncharacterized membrane protein YeaQ/YmgE (transglycosylase-associated protein family)